MIRNDDIIEDFVPTEHYSMHSVPNIIHNGNEFNEFPINRQILDNNCEQQNCETFANPSDERNVSANHLNSIRVHEIGFYGWRKKCLYFFVLLVTVAVVINAALTLWIIAVLSFSMEGIGKLRIQSTGLQLSGEALLLDNVYAGAIRSTQDQSLRIQSDNSIIMNARHTNSNSNVLSNRLFVANDRVNGIANQFVVKSPDGRLLFLVSDKNVVVATDKLRVNNAAGIRFNGSIQVPLVQSTTLDELNVLSPTRRIKIKGPQKVFTKCSFGGNLLAKSVNNLHFRSKQRIIHLDSKQIEFRDLRIAYPTKRGRTYPAIYQLCVCGQTGKLFMVPPEASCRTDSTVC